jgi:tRNA threonylcarbamoyladenosine biosynthesis protein TsaB
MIILGIDTSGYINAVGITDGTRTLADNRFPARTDTLEQIVDNIDVTLNQVGMSFKDVEGIGVGLGPGSWTGIKVGVTVGKMLAFSAGKPVAGIPTLDALTYSVCQETLPVYAVIGAGVKDMVYAARYRFKENEPVREGEYFAGDIRELAKAIREPIILVGPNAKYYREVITKEYEPAGDKAKGENGRPADKTIYNTRKQAKNEPVGKEHSGDFIKLPVKAVENEPDGAWVACLAALHFERGKGDNPLSLTPLYLKESTAKVFINKYAANKDK